MTTIHTDFKQAILGQIDDGTITSLELTHAVFYTDYEPFLPSDTKAGKNEIGRTALTSSIVDNTVIKSFNINTSTANCLSTTISSVTSTTVFDLTSVTSLLVDDRIEITVSGVPYQRKVSNISTNTVTISEALPVNPSVGDTVKQMISNIGFVADGTSSSGTGTLFLSVPYIKYKSSGIEINNNQLRGIL